MRGNARVIAIAAIVENGDGSISMVGSKQVINGELGVRQDYDFSPYALPPPTIYHFEFETRDMTMWRTTPVSGPLLIEQRGIYLPDMSFKALPG